MGWGGVERKLGNYVNARVGRVIAGCSGSSHSDSLRFEVQMRNLGVGVMIRMLDGNKETVEAVTKSLGKTIVAIRLNPDVPFDSGSAEGDADTLIITLDDSSVLKLWDAGQSCCESRYMRTDDNLNYHVGATLQSIELRDGPVEKGEDEDDFGEVHDIQFLVVTTSKGVITCSSHNEHNGYYGGFAIEASLTQADNPL